MAIYDQAYGCQRYKINKNPKPGMSSSSIARSRFYSTFSKRWASIHEYSTKNQKKTALIQPTFQLTFKNCRRSTFTVQLYKVYLKQITRDSVSIIWLKKLLNINHNISSWRTY